MRRFVLRVVGWFLIGAGLLLGSLNACTIQPHPTAFLQNFLPTPTPTPLPTPTPTPTPTLPSSPLLDNLDLYFLNQPVAVRLDKLVVGIHNEPGVRDEMYKPGGVYAAYGLVKENGQTYVLLAGESRWSEEKVVLVADLVPLSDLPEGARQAVQNLPLLTGWDDEKQSLVQLSLEQAFARAQHAVGWTIYNREYKPGPLELTLTAPDGSTETITIDIEKAANGDPDERAKIWHIMHDYHVVYDVGSHKVIPNQWQPEPTEKDLDRFIAGLRILLYHTNFSPAGVWTGGQIEGNQWHVDERIGYNDNGIPRWVYAGPVAIQGPGRDRDQSLHPNLDIDFLSPLGEKTKFAVYNPFTGDVQPTIVEVDFWKNPNAEPGENPYQNASVIVEVTDPETGLKIPIGISHLDVESSPLLKQLRERGTPLNGWITVETSIPLEPGQYIAKVTTPLNKGGTDPYSIAEHVEFGLMKKPELYTKYEDLSPYTSLLVACASICHDGIETIDSDPWVIPAKYRKDTGFWFGKNRQNHAVTYTSSTPSAVYHDPVSGAVYHGYVGGKSEPGWKQQLPPHLRKSRHPRSAFMRRSRPPKPKPYL